MISAGWVFLTVMVGMYGAANLLQSIAATNTREHDTLDPKLLVQLARHRTYIAGLLCQILGFVLAFLARRDLPLFLVQSAMAAGLGVTAVLGVVMLKWKLPVTEIVLLVLLCGGIAALVVAAQPHPSRQLNTLETVGLVGILVTLAPAGFFAAKLRGVPGSVALGTLAGIAFAGAAVASRPLAGGPSPESWLGDPLLYLLIVYSLVGQLLLGLAMQRGSTTAAVAAMDAAAAVPAAIIGLVFLGDRITPGREWLAATGFLVTLGSVIGLSYFAEPQHQQVRLAKHRVPERPLYGVHTRTAVARRKTVRTIPAVVPQRARRSS